LRGDEPAALAIGACAEVAAIFYSLIQLAKLAGVEPGAYLREAARRGIRNRGAEVVTLPHELRDPDLRPPTTDLRTGGVVAALLNHRLRTL